MFAEGRRSLFPPELLIRVGLAWAAVCALLIVLHFSAIAALRFPDPDDAMRLVQVRDLIAGQGWFDVTQYRANMPGGGVPMHWSRLVDLPIAAVILALTPVTGAANAEIAALVVVPLITLGLAMLFAARIAWRLLGKEEAVMTCLVLAMSVPALFQLSPLRIDHHGWQIVAALAAINGLMARSPKAGGLVAGSCLAVWLSISIEGLPLAAAICVVTAIRWLRDRNDRAWLVATMQGLALTSIILFIGTRGFGDLATYCDAIAPVHLAIFVWGAAALTVLAKAEPLPKIAVLGGFALIGAGALGIVFAAAPQCASGGGFAALDPLVEQYWYVNIKEGRPIWEQQLKVALQYAIAPLVGIFAALNLVSRSQNWLRQFWIDYTVILIAAFVIALFVARAGAVAGVIAAVPLAWQVRQWLRAVRLMRKPAPRALALAGVVLALVPAFPLMLLDLVKPAPSAVPEEQVAAASSKASACEVSDNVGALRRLEPGEVFAPLDISPRILLESDHSVIASSHHRGSDAMAFVIATSLGSVDEAQSALATRGTSYVALCPGMYEPNIYAQAAPDGFLAVLVKGGNIEWLEPITTDANGTFRMWRIKPE